MTNEQNKFLRIREMSDRYLVSERIEGVKTRNELTLYQCLLSYRIICDYRVNRQMVLKLQESAKRVNSEKATNIFFEKVIESKNDFLYFSDFLRRNDEVLEEILSVA